MIFKRKIDKLDLIKIKIIHSAKVPDKRMKEQAIKQDKLFAKYILSKGPVSRIYKEHSKLKAKKKKKSNSIRKWAKEMTLYYRGYYTDKKIA